MKKWLALLAVGAAQAQGVYKCGSTYSQTPCAPDAQKIEVKAAPVDCSSLAHTFTDACKPKPVERPQAAMVRVQKEIDALPRTPPPPRDVIDANKQLCRARVLSLLKDPESARVEEVRRAEGPAPDYDSAMGWFPSISYNLRVNAKNSYGGYTGTKLWACSFDLKEREILKVKQFDL